MKFLRLIATCDPRSGGPIAGLLGSSNVLKEMGHETFLATLDAPDAPWVLEFPFKVFGLGPAARPYGYTRHLVPWLAANAANYDVIIIHGLWNYISVGSWRGLRRAKRPYVVFTHGSLDPWHRKFYPLKDLAKRVFWLALEGRVLSDAYAVLFTSREEQILARSAYWGHGGYASKVIAYGAPDVKGESVHQERAFRELCGLHPKDKYLVFLGRIHPKKGVDSLLEAFAATAPNDYFLVVGGPDQIGWTAALKQKAATLGIGDRVRWPGMLTGDLKWGAYRGAEAFALPSHGENFGIVVAEALACGTPALITEKVNIWREIVQERAGLAAECPATFGKVLSAFFSLNGSDRIEMRHNARACFRSHFDVRKSAEDLVRLGTENAICAR